MNNYWKGHLWEDYIEHVYRLLLDLDSKPDDEPILISRNVKLEKNGYTSEFDIYYEFTKAGVRHKVAIECKNHRTSIDISQIRDFYGKLCDFNLIGVFISNSGFQSGAKSYAKEKDILLLTTEDIPNFFNLIGLRLKQIYLPTKYVKGEPFYVLMEHRNGILTGSYHVIKYPNHHEFIFLFLSKKLAYDYLKTSKEEDLLVRGLKQEAFDFFILFAKRMGLNFAIVCVEKEIGEHFIIEIEPEQLKTNYYDLMLKEEK